MTDLSLGGIKSMLADGWTPSREQAFALIADVERLQAAAESQRVTTFEELDALPDGSFVFHHSVVWKARTAAERYGGYRFWTGAVNDNVETKRTEQMNLPMQVLYRSRTASAN